MSEIKIYNDRQSGWVFHYAHFMCDLVLPDIVQKVYEHDICYRLNTEQQTIGNFKPLWEKIMGIKTIEISNEEFENKNIPLKISSRFENNKNKFGKKEINEFKKYIYKRFDIKPDYSYPEIILIERGENKNLVNNDMKDKLLLNNKFALTTGKSRREIENIDLLKEHLSDVPYKCIMLEHMDIEEQIKYFYNAKIIIAAHGAAMSNLLFCRENTIMIEIMCGNWEFFNIISHETSIKHIKCVNNVDEIMKVFITEYEKYIYEQQNILNKIKIQNLNQTQIKKYNLKKNELNKKEIKINKLKMKINKKHKLHKLLFL